MSERAGTWASGQVSGPQIEWRTRMAPRDPAVTTYSAACARPGSVCTCTGPHRSGIGSVARTAR